MNRNHFKWSIAAMAGTVGALAALVWLGNRRLDRWENLQPSDAGEGKFVPLSDGAQMHFISRCPAQANGDVVDDVVLIHGLMDSAFHWHKNIDALASQHRVWAIDLVGFGFSSRPTRPTYSLKSFARYVREFMDAQGIERASIVGHSLGGAVALEFAHDYPERVDKLVLIAPGTFVINLKPALKFASQFSWLARGVIGWGLTSERARAYAWRNAWGDKTRVNLDEEKDLHRSVRVKGTASALVAMLASPKMSDLPAGLNEIDVPTLIMCGDCDRSIPLRHNHYHAQALPNARLVVLKGAGHIPQHECAEAVNRLMCEFLIHESRE